MSTYLSNSLIMGKAADLLANKLQLIPKIYKPQHARMFGQQNNKAGSSIQIRIPVRTVTRSGETYSAQATTETSATLTLQTLIGDDFDINATDKTLKIEDYAQQYLENPMSDLAAKIESLAMGVLMPQIANFVGTPGVTPGSLAVVQAAKKKLDQHLARKDNTRCFLVTSNTESGLVDAFKGLFQDSSSIAEQYTEGFIGRTQGFTFMSNELLPNYTTGLTAGTLVVHADVTSGNSIVIDGFTTASGTFTAGTVFTIAGVYDINPQTKVVTNNLRQFVATAAATVASNSATVTVFPAIDITATGTQTVSAKAAANASVTILSSANPASTPVGTNYTQNLAFHPEFASFVSVKQDLPINQQIAEQAEADGLWIRLVQSWDISSNSYKTRFDCLWGTVAYQPDLACRVTE